MCNLYNITPAHEAMLGLFPKFGDVANRVGPQMDIFPDYPAPVLRNIRIGEPELALLRWASSGSLLCISLMMIDTLALVRERLDRRPLISFSTRGYSFSQIC